MGSHTLQALLSQSFTDLGTFVVMPKMPRLTRFGGQTNCESWVSRKKIQALLNAHGECAFYENDKLRKNLEPVLQGLLM